MKLARVAVIGLVAMLSVGLCVAQSPKDASVLQKHLSLDQWLAKKGLSRDQVDLREKDRRDVFDPVTEGYDSSVVVYEVWKKGKTIPARTIPAEPLLYADGSQALVVRETGQKRITRKQYDIQNFEQESLVKTETKYEKKPVEVTRYLVRGH